MTIRISLLRTLLRTTSTIPSASAIAGLFTRGSRVPTWRTKHGVERQNKDFVLQLMQDSEWALGVGENLTILLKKLTHRLDCIRIRVVICNIPIKVMIAVDCNDTGLIPLR